MNEEELEAEDEHDQIISLLEASESDYSDVELKGSNYPDFCVTSYTPRILREDRELTDKALRMTYDLLKEWAVEYNPADWKGHLQAEATEYKDIEDGRWKKIEISNTKGPAFSGEIKTNWRGTLIADFTVQFNGSVDSEAYYKLRSAVRHPLEHAGKVQEDEFYETTNRRR